MNGLTIYSEEELIQLQQLETDCLKVIITLCEEQNIEYFLIGGTALGAIRHDGFIPWDNDIDIGMTRQNYQRFLDIAPRLLPEKYHLQTPYAACSPYYYTKVRIDDTVFMEYCNRKLPMHQGVYIDIFPFDEVPDDEKANLAQFKSCQRLIGLFALRQIPDVSAKPENPVTKAKALLRKILHTAVQIVPRSYILKKLDREFTRYNGTGQQALACLNFPKRKTEYILKADLYPLATHPFASIEAKLPAQYDRYLQTHYGDWRQLPPPEQRFGHKPYRIEL